MKEILRAVLQKILGYDNYLFIFSIFKIRTLKYDSKENDFLIFKSLLKDCNGDILDIGANIGIMTTILSRSFPNTIIHAFEPMPSNFNALKKITQFYQLPNVKLYEVALGETKGCIEMILPEKNGTKYQGLSYIKNLNSNNRYEKGDIFSVKMDKIDDIVETKKIQGIKIDVENFEYFVLKGCISVLEQFHPIIYVELWDNENRKNCFELLERYSYKPFVVSDNTLTPFRQDIHKHQNFIFITSNKE